MQMLTKVYKRIQNYGKVLKSMGKPGKNIYILEPTTNQKGK